MSWECRNGGFDYGMPVIASLDYDCKTLTCHQQGDVTAAFNILLTVYERTQDELTILKYGRAQRDEWKREAAANWRKDWGLDMQSETHTSNLVLDDSAESSVLFNATSTKISDEGQSVVIGTPARQCPPMSATDIIMISFLSGLVASLVFAALKVLWQNVSFSIYKREQATKVFGEGPYRVTPDRETRLK